LSTSLYIVSTIISDKMQGVDKDFLASPVARHKIAGGYLISGATGSFVVTCTVFIVSLVWLVLAGASVPHISIFLKCLIIIVLTCICSSCITFFIANLIQKNGVYHSIGTIVGTLGGFLSAIYLPFGQLPAAMQAIVKLFPPSHAAVLMRCTLLEGISSVSYAHTPPGDLTKIFEYLGVRFFSSNELIPKWISLAVLVGCTFLFFGLSCLSISRRKRK
jgi:multidrug/hemolysin transport system permease protein